MQHDDIRHKLSEYIDGSVTAQERSGIEEHLRTCTACVDALTELRKTIEHIKAVEEIEPPAWLSRKIMATVRAGAEEKKGFFHRYFLPLHVKLPIQAVAVLFLAVSAYYIHQNIQPSSDISEAPLHEFADKVEIPLIGAEKDAPGKTDAPAPRSKKVPQSPEYKALDMKLEYEKPAPPVPAQQTKQPEMVTQDSAREELSTVPQAGKPAIMQEQTAPAGDKERAVGATQESLDSRRKLKTAVAEDETVPAITYVVSAKDLETATREMEATIEKLGGIITRTERLDSGNIYTITLSPQRLKELFQKMKLIGTVTGRATSPALREDRITVRIELEMKSTPP